MLPILTAGVVVAFLYFARDIVVPITLAVLLSFLLAPAVRGLRRLEMGRVAAVSFTVLVAFLTILAFAAIVVQEASSLAEQIPEYRYNIEVKVRSLKEVTFGGQVFHRIASMFRDLGKELKQAETQVSTPPDRGSAIGTSLVEPTKPVPVEIRQPELEPLQIAQSLIGPLLQPLAMAGLGIVFVIMILLEREHLP